MEITCRSRPAEPDPAGWTEAENNRLLLATRAGLHRAGSALLTALLAERGRPASRSACACGAQARYHGQRPKRLLTALGPVQLERAYYVCPDCQQGQIPRDRELDVEGTECSPGRTPPDGAGGSTALDRKARSQNGNPVLEAVRCCRPSNPARTVQMLPQYPI